MVARNLVEFVTMQDGVAPPVGRDMDVLLEKFNVAKRCADILVQHLIMVARNEDHAGATPCALEEFLNDSILVARPVNAAAHRPEIDDVSHQVEIAGFVVAQEREQSFRLAGTRAEMDVRQENRAYSAWADRLVRPLWMRLVRLPEKGGGERSGGS